MCGKKFFVNIRCNFLLVFFIFNISFSHDFFKNHTTPNNILLLTFLYKASSISWNFFAIMKGTLEGICYCKKKCLCSWFARKNWDRRELFDEDESFLINMSAFDVIFTSMLFYNVFAGKKSILKCFTDKHKSVFAVGYAGLGCLISHYR
jgi:hypothetical protein